MQRTAWTGWQGAGLAALLLPAMALMFAEEFAYWCTGYRTHYGFIRAPQPNGWYYLTLTLATAILARLGAGICVARLGVGRSRCSLFVPGDPFASRPVLAAAIGSFLALTAAFLFGHVALGAQQPANPASDVDAIRQRAAMVTGSTLPRHEGIEAFSISGFGMTQYTVRTIPRVTPQGHQWQSATYEEYGFPFRCIQSPIDIGIPRPSGLPSFFDQNQEQFIWTQLTNARLLPIPFALNAAMFAGIVWVAWSGPPILLRTIRRRVYARRGGCLECGYILKGVTRCPECGTGAAGRQEVR